MNTFSTSLYESAEDYFRAGPDATKNETLMWFVAAGILMQELSKRSGNLPFGGLRSRSGYELNKKLKPIEILDFCSGPGNFVNHLSFVYPDINAVCIDNNENFIETGKKMFPRWKFVYGDVIRINLKKKFDFITASLAYHHIENKDKIKFLKNIQRHLKSDGVIIMCEHFLPNYIIDRKSAVKKYYRELKSYYGQGNATRKVIRTMRDIEKLELQNLEEHKVSFRIFRSQLRKIGLKVDTDIIVWQPEKFRPDNAGSHVLVLRK